MTSSGTIRTGGAVVERCVYTPYGEVNVMQGERDQGGSVSGFGDRDGDEDERSECERAAIGKASRHARVRPARRPGGSEHEVSDRRVDSTDKGTVGTTCTGTVTGECRILDLDFDGDYDSTDATLFNSLPQGVGRHPGKFASGVDQPFHHQGLLFEPEVRQYQNRARQYDPGKKRFGQRDPLGRNRKGRNAFADGLDLYLYQRSSPINLMDFDGHAARKCKSVQCHCSHGDITVPLTGNSSFAGLVIGIGFGSGSQGCVTLPGHIYCNMSCSAIRSSGILCHECCHACAAADGFLGFFRWVGTWIGDLSGYCEDNAVPYEGGTCGSAPAV